MRCKICDGNSDLIFSKEVLNRYMVNYYQCNECGFIQTEDPYWLKEAYENPINIEDSGLVSRNLLFTKRSTAVLASFFDKRKQFLDFAGGYGLFVRLMRDIGFDFYWSDTFTENIFARGFEFNHSLHNEIEVITVFECFEHFVDPMLEIKKLLGISKNILFSTEIFPFKAPDPEQWSYYAYSHGQHISFYSKKTLQTIAKKFNLNLYSNDKSFHLLTPKKLNNGHFKLLLILSIIGLSSFIKITMQSKTHTDSEFNNKNKTLLF